MNSYDTIYSCDYIVKPYSKPESFRRQEKTTDTIADSFQEFLKTDTELKPYLNNGLEATDYLENTFRKEHPKLAEKHFSTPLDSEVIRKHLIKMRCSTYQDDYSNIAEGEGLQKKTIDVEMHEIAVKMLSSLPTTYSSSYRRPDIIDKNIFKRRGDIRPLENLGRPFLHERFLVTEYGDVISRLGGHIITEELHGDIVHDKIDLI